MQCGQKVQSGERIGKTIIFGYNHDHADLIVQRFKALYPEYGDDFCVLIDNRVNYSQSLIDNFEVRDNMPQIAVSVDMLDTGIDVPDILNLVFFKPVHSKIKFMQMIGRGTRLSDDIFGVGQHKEFFNIFDWCGNFEYFSINDKGKEPLPMQSLTERLFCVSVDLAVALQHSTYQEDAFAKGLHDRVKEGLCAQVKELKDTHIAVRKRWETVDKFRNSKSWEYLSSVDAVLLKEEISPLLVKSTMDENAKKFDLLMLNIELSKVAEDVNSTKSQRKVVQIGQLLQERASIPQVAAKLEVIKEVVSPSFWANPSLQDLERVREELRELVKFIIGGDNRTFTLNIEDMVIEMGVAEEFTHITTYHQRVIDYLAKNRNLPVVQKIINIEQLDHNDVLELERILWKELGTKEDYAKYIERGNMLCGDCVAAFIRSIVGVDRSVAVQKFSAFLSDSTLNSEQEDYLKSIITYVCKNGDITAETIVNESPFSDFEWLDTFGQNFIYVRKYIDVLHNSIVG
ncbi:MAG: helicase, partial [Alistipes sp.]|nr:helicase [Alistipes sp.]